VIPWLTPADGNKVEDAEITSKIWLIVEFCGCVSSAFLILSGVSSVGLAEISGAPVTDIEGILGSVAPSSARNDVSKER
jgi:hypothetical membrane protein